VILLVSSGVLDYSQTLILKLRKQVTRRVAQHLPASQGWVFLLTLVIPADTVGLGATAKAVFTKDPRDGYPVGEEGRERS